MNNIYDSYRELLQPQKVWPCCRLFAYEHTVPKLPGIYAWYFCNSLTEVPTDDCVTYKGLKLLYIGIAPKSPMSDRNLYQRLKDHINGNAFGSTLRLSLGCLLSEQLNIQLRRVSSGKRMTFADGEKKLSEWIANNAYVIWKVHDAPWSVEEEIIQAISLPLNIEHNERHRFYPILSAKRKEAKTRAKELPIVEKQ